MPKYQINGGLVQYKDAAIIYFKDLDNMRGFVPPVDNVALAIITGDPPSVGSGGLYGWSADISTSDNGTTIITPRVVLDPNSEQAGSPEGATVGSIGDINQDTTSLSFYRKATGTATNTGWVIIPGRWVRIISP
jgi:hypothetical protein